MAIAQVDEQSFEREVLQSELPVLVEFGAEWCGPCKTVAPELEALARDLAGKAKIVSVDVDRSPMLAQYFQVQSVPTFFVVHQGRPVKTQTGALRKAQLRAMVEPFLPRAAGAIKPDEAAQLVRQGRITFVDLRDPRTYGRVHLPGAINLPLTEIEQRLAELQMTPGVPVLYCRTGKEAQELADRLRKLDLELGYLEGGILDWEAAGHPIERG